MLASKTLGCSASATPSPAWDVSNAVFLGTPVNFFRIGRTGQAIFFKPDGTKMYWGDVSSQSVVEYDLSTAWDVSTAVFVREKGSISAPQIYGLFFKPDGTKMYIAESLNGNIREYDLSTAWNVSTVVFLQQISVVTNAQNPNGLFFKPDGLKMYVVGDASDVVSEYDLSTAWNVSTAVFLQSFSVATQETTPKGLFFRDDGLKMYVNGSSGDDVNEYDLSTAWNVSTAVFVRIFSVFAQTGGFPGNAFFKSDGTVMYVYGTTPQTIYQYQISTAWNISTATFSMPTTKYFSVAAQETSPQGLFFKPDGLKMYVIGAIGDDVNEYDLSTAWAVSTATYVQNFSVSAQETAPQSVFFKPDGTKMYVLGGTGDDVNEYTLIIAWNISTAVYLQSFSITTQETNPAGLSFKSDGTKMYVLGFTGDDVNEYDLSTAWDISTAVFLQLKLISAQETDPFGLFFKPDGTKMYVCGDAGDDVNEYTLSTAWDVTTASFVRVFSFAAQTVTPVDIFFRDDGLQMYVLSNDSDAIWEYDLV